MTTPTVQFSHESRYTVINRPRAWRVAATTIALYLIASLCLQHDSSPLRHLIGLALLVMVTQLASPRLVQQVSLSLRGVTPSDTPRPVEMTPDNWTRVVAQIHRAAAAAVQRSRGPFEYGRVVMDIPPETFRALLQSHPVLLPLELSYTDPHVEDETPSAP
jgi:hypothetical protein